VSVLKQFCWDAFIRRRHHLGKHVSGLI
jgi:hypothetical protein